MRIASFKKLWYNKKQENCILVVNIEFSSKSKNYLDSFEFDFKLEPLLCRVVFTCLNNLLII